jgi:hypothetical protein
MEMMGIPIVNFRIEEMKAEEERWKAMIIDIRDVSDSVGIEKRIGKRLKSSYEAMSEQTFRE